MSTAFRNHQIQLQQESANIWQVPGAASVPLISWVPLRLVDISVLIVLMSLGLYCLFALPLCSKHKKHRMVSKCLASILARVESRMPAMVDSTGVYRIRWCRLRCLPARVIQMRKAQREPVNKNLRIVPGPLFGICNFSIIQPEWSFSFVLGCEECGLPRRLTLLGPISTAIQMGHSQGRTKYTVRHNLETSRHSGSLSGEQGTDR